MSEETFYWEEDKLKFLGKNWAVENPQAVMLIVHGMGEHSGRYQEMVSFFNRERIAVMAYDQRGHGQSEGKRGHTPSFTQLLSDLAVFLGVVKENYPNIPIFLLGHSMGGNIVLNYALRYVPPVRGIIASSPYLRLAFQPPGLKVTLGRIIANILPKFSQATELDITALSQDIKVIEAYKNDPLVHDQMSAKFFVENEKAAAWALAHASQLQIPTLVYHGTADRITDWKASQEFAENNKNITYKAWEGLYHETHNEIEKKEIFNFVFDWMRKI